MTYLEKPDRRRPAERLTDLDERCEPGHWVWNVRNCGPICKFCATEPQSATAKGRSSSGPFAARTNDLRRPSRDRVEKHTTNTIHRHRHRRRLNDENSLHREEHSSARLSQKSLVLA
jgi:hypothetical protein